MANLTCFRGYRFCGSRHLIKTVISGIQFDYKENNQKRFKRFGHRFHSVKINFENSAKVRMQLTCNCQ